MEEVKEGRQGESERNENDPADDGEPERVPCVAWSALEVTGSEMLADEGVDDGEHPHGEGDGGEGVDSTVALCREFGGSDKTDHPCVDELHDGVGGHGEDGWPGDGPEFAEGGDFCGGEMFGCGGGVHVCWWVVLVRRDCCHSGYDRRGN